MNIPGSKPLPPIPGELIGPTPSDLEVIVNIHLSDVSHYHEVADYLVSHGLGMVTWNPQALMMRVQGTPLSIKEAFEVVLTRHSIETSDHHYHTHTGHVVVPDHFDGKIEAVIGLDTRPMCKPHFRMGPGKKIYNPHIIDQRTATAQPELPSVICKAMQVPKSLLAVHRNAATGIIELGGDYLDSDTKASCQAQEITVPTVTHRSTDGSGPSGQGTSDGATGEVHLDVQWVASIFGYASAPCNIKIFWGANTAAGYIGAINDAATDPDVVGCSTSWGSPDSHWPAGSQERAMANKAVQLMGINDKTFYAAAGDDGANDGTNSPQGDFPASAAGTFACNGSKLYIDSATGLCAKETVWNNGPNNGATGGAISTVEPLPSYQVDLSPSYPMRVVADLTWVSDPDTAGVIWMDGQPTPIGGTSGASPAYAALTTLIYLITGKKLGDWHALLYQQGDNITNDITEGNNNGYSAGPGYDVCTGWGSLNCGALITLLLGTNPIPTPVPTPVPQPIPTPTPVPSPPPVPNNEIIITSLRQTQFGFYSFTGTLQGKTIHGIFH